MMKGFIKILESIIASLIILTSITFFFGSQPPKSEWDDTLLKMRAEDVLASLEKSGLLRDAVRQNNNTNLTEVLLNHNISAVGLTTEYAIEIRGIPNPVIYIGCNCSSDDIATLEGILSPLSFVYKGRQIEIRIARSDINNIDPKTDILFIFNYKNLTPWMTSINEFLGKGGTIFVLGSLTRSQVEDGVMNQTFGLAWTAPGSTSGQFYDSGNENKTSFRIAKYMANISHTTGPFDFGQTSSVAVDNRTIVSGTTSLVKINKELVEGNGRTVWFSGFNFGDSAIKNLTKATVMWASGERFQLGQEKTPLPKHVRVKIPVFDQDTYEANLILWRILD